MEIKLDFDYDEDVVELYHQCINFEFTAEFINNPRTLDKDQVRNRLYEISKSKQKNGYELHGILKAYVDGKLAAISFPRQILPAEYDKFSLKAVNKYHRLSGIFVDPEFRGQGIALKVVQWFIDKYKFILWTAHTTNYSSIKTAQKANLTEIKERDVVNDEGEVLFRTKVFSN
jgi:GNAT superfamily N-acetyltransferase